MWLCVRFYTRAVHSTIFFLSRIVNLLLSGRVYIWLLSVSHHRREESEEWTTTAHIHTYQQQNNREKKVWGKWAELFHMGRFWCTLWIQFGAFTRFNLVVVYSRCWALVCKFVVQWHSLMLLHCFALRSMVLLPSILRAMLSLCLCLCPFHSCT